MEITETRIKLLSNAEGPVKAIATIVIDDAVAVHGIRVRANKNGDNYYVAMPCRKEKEDYVDIFHPINQETREYISNTILKQFKAMMPMDLPAGGEVVAVAEPEDTEEDISE